MSDTPEPTADNPVASAAELLAHAHKIEADAAEHYGLLAEQMETHNNPEVAKLFRKLEWVEGLHADKILARLKSRFEGEMLVNVRDGDEEESPVERRTRFSFPSSSGEKATDAAPGVGSSFASVPSGRLQMITPVVVVLPAASHWPLESIATRVSRVAS